jgi:hypothetical protein
MSDSSASGVARAVRYEFLIAERPSGAVLASFPELQAAPGPAGGTALWGEIEDTAHLHGVLARFQTFGIDVLEMRRLPD